MDPSAFEEVKTLENHHWWFKGRRAVFSALLDTLELPQNSKILEIGCGNGGNLSLLARYGELSGIEYDPTALDYAKTRCQNARLEKGSLPHEIPFPGESFDLIVLLDVLEHIEQEAESLKEIFKRLNPGGKLFVAVPAFQLLWSAHDIHFHHYRRYQISHLRTLIEDTGFQSIHWSYYNFWLFPLVLISRLIQKIIPPKNHNLELKLPPGFINSFLYFIFKSESRWVKTLRFPFGLSLFAIAEKPTHLRQIN